MITEPSKDEQRGRLHKLANSLTEFFGLSHGAALSAIVVMSVVLALAFFFFFRTAPPHTLIITSGPPGSVFETNAGSFRTNLANNGVTLKILPSHGSAENLKRLADPNFDVQIGFVQGGITNAVDTNSTGKARELVSLGSLFYEPLFVFYRGTNEVTLLSELSGRRLVIGPEGSGTHEFAMNLLELNGMTNAGTSLLNYDADEAARELLNGRVDAVFLMGDSASVQVLRQLLHDPQIHLLDFAQADGYTRRIPYLSKLELPMGSIDFGKNIPPHDIHLIGPTVELLARRGLHPALSDLLLEAARKIYGKPTLLRRKDEFPAPIEHDIPISADASRFYKSGKKFLYGVLPLWLASLASRALVIFIPTIVVLIPILRFFPAIYKWRIRLLIYRRYRELLALEREVQSSAETDDKKKHPEFLERLDGIEESVDRLKVPASFGDQLYTLRGHVAFVRQRLDEAVKSS